MLMKNVDYLKINEVADFFRVQPLTVRRWALAGRIPSHKVGKQWRFSLSEITAWAAKEGKRGAKQEILIVDDDDQVRHAFFGLFAREGFLTRQARNGKEALSLIEESQPSLILLDLDMPVMNGPDTLAVLRDRFPRIPVIVVTSFGDSNLMEEALQHTPFTVVNKPCNLEELVSTVKQQLGLPS